MKILNNLKFHDESIYHLDVKVWEENEEWEHVGAAGILHPHGEVTTNLDGIDAHHEGGNKL